MGMPSDSFSRLIGRWIEGVRNMHNMFHHHSPSEFTEDLHVPLTDGSKNWIRIIYPVKKAALNKAGGMLIYILFVLKHLQ